MAHVIDYESIIQNAENIGKDSELLSKIEMDENTGVLTKNCGDASKSGCKEGNTW